MVCPPEAQTCLRVNRSSAPDDMCDHANATVVLVRHGESVFNAADRFTGLRCSLVRPGRREAAEAGRMMIDAHLDPGLVYTSVLSRTLETADHAGRARARPGRDPAAVGTV